MCSTSCIIFEAKNLSREDVAGKRVLEVGSYDVNGSIRPLINSWKPSEYVGVDMVAGPGVDVICNAECLVEKFGKERFDVVICTSVLEHVREWRKVVSGIKNVCRRGGVMLISVPSYGFKYHGYPYDFWRYELEDMKNIFSDCKILSLEKDDNARGVFTKFEKPAGFVEKDLSNYKLYSIVVDRRLKGITDKDLGSLRFIYLSLKWKFRVLIFETGKTFLRFFDVF